MNGTLRIRFVSINLDSSIDISPVGSGSHNVSGIASLVSARTRLNAPHAQVLDLEELLDPVHRPFPPEARLFHSAKRGDLVGNDPRVNAHDTVFERLRDRQIRPMSRL